VRQHVLAYVTRRRAGGRELLVFDHRDHPEAGTQVPAGRANPGETLEQALRRELVEEAGLENVRIVRELPVLGTWTELSPYENHAFEVHAEGQTLDSWEHTVSGADEDAGLAFRYRWVPIDSKPVLWDGDPTYTQLR